MDMYTNLNDIKMYILLKMRCIVDGINESVQISVLVMAQETFYALSCQWDINRINVFEI